MFKILSPARANRLPFQDVVLVRRSRSFSTSADQGALHPSQLGDKALGFARFLSPQTRVAFGRSAYASTPGRMMGLQDEGNLRAFDVGPDLFTFVIHGFAWHMEVCIPTDTVKVCHDNVFFSMNYFFKHHNAMLTCDLLFFFFCFNLILSLRLSIKYAVCFHPTYVEVLHEVRWC